MTCCVGRKAFGRNLWASNCRFAHGGGGGQGCGLLDGRVCIVGGTWMGSRMARFLVGMICLQVGFLNGVLCWVQGFWQGYWVYRWASFAASFAHHGSRSNHGGTTPRQFPIGQPAKGQVPPEPKDPRVSPREDLGLPLGRIPHLRPGPCEFKNLALTP